LNSKQWNANPPPELLVLYSGLFVPPERSTTVFASIAALPVVAMVLPPLFTIFLRIQKLYLSTSREIKRIEGVNKSPVYTLLVLREKRLYTTSYDLGGVATAVVLRNCLAGVLHLTSVLLAAVLHLTSWSRNTRLADCGAACPLR
jgi:hypothetical protein